MAASPEGPLAPEPEGPLAPGAGVPGSFEGEQVDPRRVLRNTLSNYAGQIASMAVWFALTPFMLHRLGVVQYGLWVLVASLVAYGSLLDLGVGGAVTKFVAEYRARGADHEASGVVATALRLYCALGLVAFALSLALAWAAPKIVNVPSGERSTLSWLIVVSGAGLALQVPATLSHAVLRGLQRYDVINIVGTLAVLAFGAASVVILLAGGGVVSIAAATIPLTLIWQVPVVFFIRLAAPELRFGSGAVRRDLVRSLAGFSSALLVINAAGMIMKKTDEIVIAAVLPVARVAPYSVARRASDLPGLLTYQFVRVLMPLASHLHGKQDSARLQDLYITSTRIALAMFIPVAAGLMVLARPFLAAWVGPQYAGSADIIVILTGAGLLEIGLWPASMLLQGTGRHRPLAFFSASAAALNLGLSVVLVQTNGVTGVALGTLVATSALTLVVTPYALRVNGVSLLAAIREIFIPATAPAVPAVLTLFALRDLAEPSSLPAVAAVGLAGLLVYAAGYLAFRVSVRERQAILRLALGTRAFARGKR